MKTLAPATGFAQWMGKLYGDNPCLRIVSGSTDDVFEVNSVPEGYNLCRFARDGETTPDGLSTVMYHVRMVGLLPTCSCPDAVFRPERKHNCKHVRALRVALPKLKTD